MSFSKSVNVPVLSLSFGSSSLDCDTASPFTSLSSKTRFSLSSLRMISSFGLSSKMISSLSSILVKSLVASSAALAADIVIINTRNINSMQIFLLFFIVFLLNNRKNCKY